MLAAFRNPHVLLLGLFGFLLIGVITAINLNAPLILQGATKLDDKWIGYVVALGGIMGAASIAYSGNHADKYGDRWGNAFWCCLILAGAVLVIGLAPSPMMVVIAYLVFATVCFTIPMLTSSGWAEVLHVRELAVGAAAINTICQIGAFLGALRLGRRQGCDRQLSASANHNVRHCAADGSAAPGAAPPGPGAGDTARCRCRMMRNFWRPPHREAAKVE